MSNNSWNDVDRYLEDQLLGSDPVLQHVLAASDAAGLPAIAVSPLQGRLLQFLVRATGAQRVLELGTLAGYSAICMARGLPEAGKLVTIEADPRHADVARGNLEHAGVADLVDVRVGAALDVLPQLDAERLPDFDFVFIDADKDNYPAYLEWSLKLCRSGALIVADNVVREGAVIDAASKDPLVLGVRSFLETAGSNPMLSATAIQTVGVKGYDGLALLLVEK